MVMGLASICVVMVGLSVVVEGSISTGDWMQSAVVMALLPGHHSGQTLGLAGCGIDATLCARRTPAYVREDGRLLWICRAWLQGLYFCPSLPAPRRVGVFRPSLWFQRSPTGHSPRETRISHTFASTVRA